MNYQKIFAERTKHIRAGEITKLLAAAAREDILSLAGGHPARETFPVREIKKINRYIYEKHSADILQYDLSCGNKILREELQKYLEERNIIVPLEEIGISSGAQNAIDAAAKVLINKGDKIATEFPTFFYSIQTFLMYEPEIVEIRSDREGILPEDFEKKCKKEKIKFLYIIPNFQNPKGSCLSYERRVQILAIARKYDVIILEDDPYFELRYEGNDIPCMKSLCPEIVIYVGSFSKTLSPGMRLGYYVAPKEISNQMTAVRQVDDIHANRYAQILLYEYIHNGYLQKNLKKTKRIYSQRLNILSENLETYVDITNFSWEKPQGGLFLWIEGPKNFNAITAYHECVAEGIAFVPGNFFYKDHKNNNNCIRLNFTNLGEEQLITAVKKLAKVLNKGTA